ncbi:hypothetical protein AB833_11200 [Chromatiales bacterium (ex Bugula neritina AB1)]|nr:hypothetical protein AB833_11200 [Chromatiales bacterium (ex Bugula neritina AB1)]
MKDTSDESAALNTAASAIRRALWRLICRFRRIDVDKHILAFAFVTTAAITPALFADDSTLSDSAGDLRVVVRPGDNLTLIAKRELNSFEAWSEIARFNKLDRPDLLQPGDVIFIPYRLLREHNFATVVFSKGEVFNLHDGEKKALVKGDSIFPGDLVTTGADGFASLAFKGASLVNIQPESEVLLEVLECVNEERSCSVGLSAMSGQLNLNVENDGFEKPVRFIINTPYASAAVRGTKFDFDTLEGNVLGVTDGEVQINIDGESVVVPSGKGTLSGPGRSIQDQFNLLPAPTLSPARRLSPEDYFSWQELDGAENYRAVIAKLATRTEVVRRMSGSDNYIKTSVAPGRYLVQVRGIDSRGLKGFFASQEIRVQAIDENITPPELDIELADEILRIKPIGTGILEVRISESLHTVGEDDVLLNDESYELIAGETFEARVDPTQPLYIIARLIIDDLTVSSYGALYVYAGTER